jgi:protocatechuate 3,4-dioxygenase beta subunit
MGGGCYNSGCRRPGPTRGRTPHIHYRVIAPGFDRLTTQLYAAEDAERNARDSLYNRHTLEEQALLTTAFREVIGGSVVAEFNIVLG